MFDLACHNCKWSVTRIEANNDPGAISEGERLHATGQSEALCSGADIFITDRYSREQWLVRQREKAS